MRVDLAVLAALDRLQADHRRHVQRGRQVRDHGVQQGLHALVLERRAAQDRRELAGERRLADRRDQLRRRDLLLLEDQLHERVVVVRDLLEQVLAGRLGLLEQLARDLDHRDVLAEVVVVDDGLHLDQVDDALEVALGADRQLDRHGVRAEAVDHRLHAALEVGADAVHLVDVGDARDLVLVGLAPDGLGLWLYTSNGVEQRDCTIEDAQRALDLDREVHVARRIDDVDAVISPLARGGGRRDRDTALLLLLHPVHRGGALVDLAHLVGLSGVIQDALGRRRLARIDVGHDPDVSGLFERELARHGDISSLCAVFLRRVPRQRAKKRALTGPCRSHTARPCSRVGYVSRDSM